MAESGQSWLKWGCLGCLALIGLGIFVVAGIGGIAWMQVGNESPVKADVRTETASPGIDAAPGEAAVTRIVLDVSHADVLLEQSAEGLRLEASYDENSFALEEARESDESGNVVWKIGFRKTSPFVWTAIRVLFGGTKPTVKLWVPPDVNVAFEGLVASGSLQGEIERMDVRWVDMRFERSAAVLQFESPMAEPMERFVMRCDKVGVVVASLGNASPRVVTIESAMGGGVLDLRGEWRNDADISIDSRMGGGSLVLPDGVIIEGLEGHSGFRGGREPEIAPPTLRFSLTQQRGEWEVSR